jgi:uncharacterized membrane protein YfcA
VVGIPFGTALLSILDVSSLKALTGIVVSLAAIALLVGFKREIKDKKLGFALAGFASGVLNGSTTMSGPPVVLFLANQGTDKESFRSDLVAYFSALYILTIPFYFAQGLLTGEVLDYSLNLLPAVATGAVAGSLLAEKVDEKLFKKICLLLVLVSGIAAIASGLKLF